MDMGYCDFVSCSWASWGSCFRGETAFVKVKDCTLKERQPPTLMSLLLYCSEVYNCFLQIWTASFFYCMSPPP